MSTESPRGRLAAEARERLARETGELARRAGLPPGLGDLFVLPATAELPVEWAILEERAGGELLAVPADASPLAGTHDVEVPAGAPGGPLVLRCRFGVWLDRKVFKPELRTGVLADETVAEALRCRRRAESGEGGGEGDVSPLAEEVEADPEYQDWIAEVPARARELVAGTKARQGAVSRSGARQAGIETPRRPWRMWRMAEKLAAVLALATLGLSVYVVHLRRELGRVSPGIVEVQSEDVVLGDPTRGKTVIPLPKDASQVHLVLVLDSSKAEQEGHAEIVNASDKVLWRSSRRRLLPGDTITLDVSRSVLPDGDYTARIVPSSGADALEERITIKTEKEPAP